MPVRDTKMKDVARASKVDAQSQILKDMIRYSWPNKRQNCPPSVQTFWNSREELSECQVIILKGEKIITPEELRPQMLSILHATHQGIEKTNKKIKQSQVLAKHIITDRRYDLTMHYMHLVKQQ